MKRFGLLTSHSNNMEGIKKIEGVPHISGVPCIWDRYYRFSSAEFLGLTEWLCPHCFTNLTSEDGQLICIKECHKKPELRQQDWGNE